MEAYELRQVIELFRQLAARAEHDQATARQLRDALAESGLLAVFGAGTTLDVVDLLDAGGEETLRARLSELSLADLRGIIAARGYDPGKEAARWRSLARLTDFVVAQAREEWQRLDHGQSAAMAAASWML